MRSAGYLNIAAYFDAVPNRKLAQSDIRYLWRRIGGSPLTLTYQSFNKIVMAFLMKDFSIANYEAPFLVEGLRFFAYRRHGMEWKYKLYDSLDASITLTEDEVDYPFLPYKTDNAYMIVPYPGYDIFYIADNQQELRSYDDIQVDRLIYSALFWALLYMDDYGYVPIFVERHILERLKARPTSLASFIPEAYDLVGYDVNMGAYPLLTGARVAFPDRDFDINDESSAGLCFGLEISDFQLDGEDFKFVLNDGGFFYGGRFFHTGLFDIYIYDISKYEWDAELGTWIPSGPYEEPIILELTKPLTFPHIIFAFEKPYLFSHHYVRIDPGPGDDFEVPFEDAPLPLLTGAYTPYSGSYHEATVGNPTIIDENILKCVDESNPERYSYTILDPYHIKINHCGYKTYIYIFVLRYEEPFVVSKSVDSIKYDVLDGKTLGIAEVDDLEDVSVTLYGNPDPLYLSPSYEWRIGKVTKDALLLDGVVIRGYSSSGRMVLYHPNLAPDYSPSGDDYPVMTTWFGYAIIGAIDFSELDHFEVDKI